MKNRRPNRWGLAVLLALASLGATASAAQAMQTTTAKIGDYKTYYLDGRAIAEVGPTTAKCERNYYGDDWYCYVSTSVRDRATDGWAARVRIALLNILQTRVFDESLSNGEGTWKYITWRQYIDAPTAIDVTASLWRLSRWVGRSNGTQGIWTTPAYFGSISGY